MSSTSMAAAAGDGATLSIACLLGPIVGTKPVQPPTRTSAQIPTRTAPLRTRKPAASGVLRGKLSIPEIGPAAAQHP
jgi:hypothetical protein